MQREVDQVLSLYERRSISRRALVEGLVALFLSSRYLVKLGPVPRRSHSFTLAR